MPRRKFSFSFGDRSSSRDHDTFRTSFLEYKRRLKNFYKDLKLEKFMSNKREIARQDVLLTPKGPVELYRRDTNGKERLLSPNRAYDIVDRRSKTFIDEIYNKNYSRSNDNFQEYERFDSIYGSVASHRSSGIYREPTGRYGFAFDWYAPTSTGTQVLHEDVEVIPDRRPTRVRTYSPVRRSYSSLPYKRQPSSYSYSESISHDEDVRFNREDYDVYQYYEYDYESDENVRRRLSPNKRTVVRSRNFSRSPTPVPPIPPARSNRKPRKIISYIDYDIQSDSNGVDVIEKNPQKNIKEVIQNHRPKNKDNDDETSLSSSASGKELWKKVDRFTKAAITSNRQSKSDQSNTLNNQHNHLSNHNRQNDQIKLNGRSNTLDDNIQPNFILVGGNNSSPQNNNNNNFNNALNENTNRNSNDQFNTTDYNNLYSKAKNGFSTNRNFQDNFKKSNSLIKNSTSPVDDNFSFNRAQNDDRFNDLPGNNAVRTNPLFGSKTNDQFMY